MICRAYPLPPISLRTLLSPSTPPQFPFVLYSVYQPSPNSLRTLLPLSTRALYSLNPSLISLRILLIHLSIPPPSPFPFVLYSVSQSPPPPPKASLVVQNFEYSSFSCIFYLPLRIFFSFISQAGVNLFQRVPPFRVDGGGVGG